MSYGKEAIQQAAIELENGQIPTVNFLFIWSIQSLQRSVPDLATRIAERLLWIIFLENGLSN